MPTCAVKKKAKRALSDRLVIFLLVEQNQKYLQSKKCSVVFVGADLRPLVQGWILPPLQLWCSRRLCSLCCSGSGLRRGGPYIAELSCWHHDDKQEGMLERSPRVLEEEKSHILLWDPVTESTINTQREVSAFTIQHSAKHNQPLVFFNIYI